MGGGGELTAIGRGGVVQPARRRRPALRPNRKEGTKVEGKIFILVVSRRREFGQREEGAKGGIKKLAPGCPPSPAVFEGSEPGSVSIDPKRRTPTGGVEPNLGENSATWTPLLTVSRAEFGRAVRDRHFENRTGRLGRVNPVIPPPGDESSESLSGAQISASVFRAVAYVSPPCSGEVAEWSIAPDSKSGGPQGPGGSNPSLSAIFLL